MADDFWEDPSFALEFDDEGDWSLSPEAWDDLGGQPGGGEDWSLSPEAWGDLGGVGEGWTEPAPMLPRAPEAPGEVLAPTTEPPREGLPEIPEETPILGGLVKALREANLPTTPEHLTAPIRDLPVIGEISRGIEAGVNVLEEAARPVAGAIIGATDVLDRTGLTDVLNQIAGSTKRVATETPGQYLQGVQEMAREHGKEGDIVGTLNLIQEHATEEKQFAAALLNPVYYLAQTGVTKALAAGPVAAHVKEVSKLNFLERALTGVPQGARELTPEQIFKPGAVPVLGRLGGLFRETPESAAREALTNMADNFAHKLNAVTEGADGLGGLANLDELLNVIKTAQPSRVLALSEGARLSKWGQGLTHALQKFEGRPVLQQGVEAMRLLRAPELAATSAEVLGKRGAIFDPVVAALPKFEQLRAMAPEAAEAALRALQVEVEANVLTATKTVLYSKFLGHTGGYLAGRFPGTKYVPAKVGTAMGMPVLKEGATFAKLNPTQVDNFFASLKTYQSAVVLGLNPYYVVRNFWNNYSTMAARGVLGYWSPERSALLMRELGVNPVRFMQGFGVAGEKGFALQRVAAKIESEASRHAWSAGASKALRQLMRRGKGWDFSPATVQALRGLDPSGRLERQVAQIVERYGTNKSATLSRLRAVMADPAQAPAHIDFERLAAELRANPRFQGLGNLDDLVSDYWSKVAPYYENVRTPQEMAAARRQTEAWLEAQLAETRRAAGAPAAADWWVTQAERPAASVPENMVARAAEMQAANLRLFMEALERTADFTRPVARYTMPPALLGDLTKSVFPAIDDVKLAAVKTGEFYRDASLLNYEKRYGWNAKVSLLFPYEFWLERSALQWAEYFLDRPGMLALYADMRDLWYNKLYNEDYPERLRGLMKIDLPFVPQWLGAGVGFINPLNALFPLEQMAAPLQNLRYLMAGDKDVATRIRQMAANNEISQEEAELAIKSGKGPLWDEARASVQQLDANPFDIAGLVASPYIPMDWFWKVMTGRPQDIRGLLPIAPAIQSATAVGREMGLKGLPVEGVQVDPTAVLKERLFNAPYDEWANFRVDRALATLVAQAGVDKEAAHLAMIERTGPVYEQALRLASLEQAVPNLTGLTGWRVKTTAPGEVQIRQERDALNKMIDGLVTQAGGSLKLSYDQKKALLKQTGAWDQVSQYYDQHPELITNIEKGREVEERLRDWYQNEI